LEIVFSDAESNAIICIELEITHAKMVLPKFRPFVKQKREVGRQTTFFPRSRSRDSGMGHLLKAFPCVRRSQAGAIGSQFARVFDVVSRLRRFHGVSWLDNHNFGREDVVVIYYNVRTNYFTTSEVTDKTLSS
jgi:hypothetical protein